MTLFFISHSKFPPWTLLFWADSIGLCNTVIRLLFHSILLYGFVFIFYLLLFHVNLLCKFGIKSFALELEPWFIPRGVSGTLLFIAQVVDGDRAEFGWRSLVETGLPVKTHVNAVSKRRVKTLQMCHVHWFYQRTVVLENMYNLDLQII